MVVTNGERINWLQRFERHKVLYSYLALVQDDPTVQIVNNAQKAYVEHYIQGDPDLADLPVLSVGETPLGCVPPRGDAPDGFGRTGQSE